jgi:peroxiredoxin
MALTPSVMLDLGTAAPPFALPDVVSGGMISLDDYAGRKALLVMFICAHCPYVLHVRHELARVGRDYADKSVGIVAISSNDVERYPDDSPENLKAFAAEAAFTFPLCYDQSQTVALAYKAVCTPDLFLFDENRSLVYRGQLDDSRPGKGQPNGRDLRAALDALLADKKVSADQKPSVGCNIKWKPGNEPR